MCVFHLQAIADVKKKKKNQYRIIRKGRRNPDCFYFPVEWWACFLVTHLSSFIFFCRYWTEIFGSEKLGIILGSQCFSQRERQTHVSACTYTYMYVYICKCMASQFFAGRFCDFRKKATTSKHTRNTFYGGRFPRTPTSGQYDVLGGSCRQKKMFKNCHYPKEQHKNISKWTIHAKNATGRVKDQPGCHKSLLSLR